MSPKGAIGRYIMYLRMAPLGYIMYLKCPHWGESCSLGVPSHGALARLPSFANYQFQYWFGCRNGSFIDVRNVKWLVKCTTAHKMYKYGPTPSTVCCCLCIYVADISYCMHALRNRNASLTKKPQCFKHDCREAKTLLKSPPKRIQHKNDISLKKSEVLDISPAGETAHPYGDKPLLYQNST